MKNINRLLIVSLSLLLVFVIAGCDGITGNLVAPTNYDGGAGGGTSAPTTTSGTISVTSSPTTALVYVDGAYKGATPITISVSTGSHKFELKKSGFDTQTVTKSIATGTNTPITSTLPPTTTTGTISIYSTPSSAQVSIDGVSKGITPLTTTVNAGSHTIKITKDGYSEFSTTTTIAAGTNIPLNAAMTALPASANTPTPTTPPTASTGVVFIQTTQPSTQIFVDSKQYATSGTTANVVTSITLPTGNHIFSFVKSGYVTQTQTVNVLSTGNPIITVTLVASPTGNMGAIPLDSNPQGAMVYIDGTLQTGLTPLTVTIPTGIHTIIMTKTGYAENKFQVTIVPGTNNKVTATMTSTTGTIVLDSNPQGATVSIDGVVQPGTTPISTTQYLGQHTITMTKTGYAENKFQVTIVPGTNNKVTATMTSTTGTLSVTTTQGAQIYLNNQPISPTVSATAWTTTLAPATYTLKIGKPGYNDYITPITITKGVTTTINQQLTALPSTVGTIVLDSNPQGATLAIDGVIQIGVTPITITQKVGQHELRFTKSGYQDNLQQVTIVSGTNNKLTIPMTATPATTGTLSVTTTQGAQVYLNNEPFSPLVATTPWTKTLAPATYTLKLSKPGYNDYITPITITAGKTTTIDKILTAIPAQPIEPVVPIVTNDTVYVQTTQPSTQIVIDGKLYTTTGATANIITTISLTIGNHNFQFLKNGYTTQTKTVNVLASTNPRIIVNLVESPMGSMGTLPLDSTPQGAYVYVDGLLQTGLTPMTASLTTGSHTVKFTKIGYNDVTIPQTITTGTNAKLTAVLPAMSIPPISNMGTIALDTAPQGAMVYIDGLLQTGVTPMTASLVTGSHTIKFTKTGYYDYTTTRTITSGENTKLTGTLTTTTLTGTVFISSTPTNALVYIDNAYKGTTPQTLSVNTGTHTIKLTKDGYLDYTTTTNVIANINVPINAVLTPTQTTPVEIINGTVYILTVQPSTQIMIDGKLYTTTGSTTDNAITTVSLTTGNHLFMFLKSGYITQTQTLNVLKLSNPRVNVNLLSSPSGSMGALPLDSTPQGANVYVDGLLQTGLTPMTASLTTGSHTVKFTKTGYNDVTIPQTITTGTNAKLTAVLTAISTTPVLSADTYTDRCGDDIVGEFEECDGDVIKLPGTVVVTISKVTPSSSQRTVTLEGKEYNIVLLALNGNTKTATVSVNGAAATITMGQPKTVSGLYMHMTEISTSSGGIYGDVTFTLKSGTNLGTTLNDCTQIQYYENTLYDGGALSCTSNCTYDLSDCKTSEPYVIETNTVYMAVNDIIVFGGKNVKLVKVGSDMNNPVIVISANNIMSTIQQGQMKTVSGIRVNLNDTYHNSDDSSTIVKLKLYLMSNS
jgi:hypothetical protein